MDPLGVVAIVLIVVVGLVACGIAGTYARNIFDWLAGLLEWAWAALRRKESRIAALEELRDAQRETVKRTHEEQLKRKRAERQKLERVWWLRVEGCHPRWIKEEVIDKDPWWLTSAESRAFAMDVLGPVSSWPVGPEPWSDKAQRIAKAAEGGTFKDRDEAMRWLQSKGATIVPAEEQDSAFKLGARLPERTYREYEWLLELSPMELRRVRGTRWYYSQLDRQIEELFERRGRGPLRSLPAAPFKINPYLKPAYRTNRIFPHSDKY